MSAALRDQFGRSIEYLRISVTDRCNFRCLYCMPPEGLDWLPKVEVLTDEEINRLIRIGVEQLGIREVRFTGGEPLLRPGLVGLVAATTALEPRPEVSLTTNAIGLSRVAPALAAAGLDRINVSLDTLDRERFTQLAHRDRLDDVLAGLAHAMVLFLIASGLSLIFGVTRIVNFAHGSFYMYGAFFVFTLIGYKFGGFWPALLIAPAVVVILGVTTEILE